MSNSQVDKKIKQARIAAMVSGSISLACVVTLIRNQQLSLFNFLAFIDVIFIFSMAYGIYKKSRECAVLMFVYFLLSKLLIISTSPHDSVGTFIIGTVFLYFLFQGITGTLAYHRSKSREDDARSAMPMKWVFAGLCGLIFYVLILPGIIIAG